MKRFMAFEYNDYYPSGACNDFYGFFDTVEDALYGRNFDNVDLYDFDLEAWVTISRTKARYEND